LRFVYICNQCPYADVGSLAGAGLRHRRILVERRGGAGAVRRQHRRHVADAAALDGTVLLLSGAESRAAPSGGRGAARWFASRRALAGSVRGFVASCGRTFAWSPSTS